MWRLEAVGVKRRSRQFRQLLLGAACIAAVVAGGATTARAAERLCDPAYEDCRAPLLNYIKNETVGIDVAFWFMQDTRYQTAIINRWKAGVPVRILVDPRANPTYVGNADVIAAFASAGIPMRYRTASGILHWKTMLFAGQGVVEFDGANYSPTAFVYQAPYSDYEDESIYFSDDPSIVNSFKTKYDDLWLDTANYANYANITGPLTRIYPIVTKDPALNFPQQEDYALRILKRYSAETRKIDVIMYRVTDERHTNAMIAAMQRGVPVRIIGEMKEYRVPERQWVSYNMDRMWAAGIPFRVAAHAGLNHQKLVILYNQAMAVFGSSNWTTPSANQQQEHNYFSTKPWMFQWFVDQFERKWNNLAPNGAIETDWFTPLPPDKPIYLSPADTAVGQPISLALKWDGGPWAHLYDIYFGTDPNPPLFAANQQLGPTDPADPTTTQKFVPPLLQHGTTYYWRVVSKTMAGMTAKGAVVSFTTDGTAPPPPVPPAGASTIVMWTATDVAPGSVAGNWQWMADNSAAGRQALWNPDRGQPKISPPLAAPDNYFETTFSAMAGTGYHLWLRLRAQGNSTTNNSVSVQFDDAIDQFGSPMYRIGSAQGAEIALSDPSGTLGNWGWEDNGFAGAPATLVYFSSTGQHRLRIQQRSDGAIVDQIVLSPDAFLTSVPGGTKNDATIYGSTIDGAAPPVPSTPPQQAPPPVPSPWQNADIGVVGMAGYGEFDYNAANFSIAGGGADVWGTADALHYVYEPLNGNGTIVARVTAIQNTNVWVKAGVMIRESLAPGSTQAFMLLSAAKGTAFQRRLTTSGTSVSTTGSATLTAPYWVRLDRNGNTFSAYQSADGATWKLVGTDTIAMAANVLIGLGVSSHTTDAVSVTTFDRVAVNGVAVAPPPCSAGVAPSNQSVSADAGTTAFTVTALTSCTWSASAVDNWLTVASGASGAGNGTVSVSIAANTGPARTGALNIGGQTVTVSQAAMACTYTLTPANASVSASASGVAITVTAAASFCGWNAVSNAPWIAVTEGSTGTGNATVTLSVDANTAAARSGTVTIANQAFTVSQAAAACNLSVAPSSQAIASGGGAVAFSVSGESWCSWTAAPNDPWLSVTNGAPGAGNGSVTVTAAANSGAARTGTVSIAGLIVSVIQDAAPCSYAISPASQSIVADGGTVTTTLTTASYCTWSAAANDPWLSINGAASGSGATTVSVTASANADAARTGTVTIAGQTFTVAQTAAPPTGWSHQDIGTVSSAGSMVFDPSTSTYSVTGTGADIWGTADAFQFAYQSLTGDGSISARVTSVQNANVWTKAGVMIRETLDAGSTNALILVSAGKGLSSQRRAATGGTSTSLAGALASAPYWIRVDRAGNTFTTYQSADGVIWAQVDSGTIAMGPSAFIGMAVTSHTTTASATATFDNVNVAPGTPVPPPTLPPGWNHQDIGAVGAAGSAALNTATNTYTVKGAGADIWGTADAFHYAYRAMSGDGVVIARVATVQNTNAWTKAGVMIRETLDPSSAQASMLVSFSKGVVFQRRTLTAGTSTSTSGPLATAPYWVKLERIGSTFNAYASTDGVAWTLVGSDTIAMGANVIVGLATSSHTTTTAAQATFDNVTTP
jgi:regulation of enolase protein 1 (concanavalin A-like superfamily)